MVKSFGMSDGDLEAITKYAFDSKVNLKALDDEVSKILKESLERTKKLIVKHQDLLHLIAQELIDNEEIDEKRLYQLADFRRGCERIIL